MQLGEKILALRKARGMSQEDLAAALGVTRQTVSRWEVGSALPDAENLLQLSLLFEVSADYLLRDEEVDATPAPTADRGPATKDMAVDDVSPEGSRAISEGVVPIRWVPSGTF